MFARSTEAGSRSPDYGASAERETYGQHLDDTRAADDGVSAFVKSEDGLKAQNKVWKEVGEKVGEDLAGHNGDALASKQHDC